MQYQNIDLSLNSRDPSSYKSAMVCWPLDYILPYNIYNMVKRLIPETTRYKYSA